MPHSPLARTVDVLEEHGPAIERIVDYAFWQLMLLDDLDEAALAVAALCDALRARFGQVARAAHPLAELVEGVA